MTHPTAKAAARTVTRNIEIRGLAGHLEPDLGLPHRRKHELFGFPIEDVKDGVTVFRSMTIKDYPFCLGFMTLDIHVYRRHDESE
jgi:hypothetical protein